MKLFLDTANLEEIREAVTLGVIKGITTNPPIIRKSGTKDIKSQINKINSIIDGTVIAEVLSTDKDGMIKEGKEIASWGPKMAVKIPMTWDGIKAVHELNKLSIKTVITIVFTASQALLAAQAGATYVAPFVCRSSLICQDGLKLVHDIADIFRIQNIKTQILTGSVETPLDVVNLAKAGADVITVPFITLKQMANHPITDITLKEFLTGWENESIV